MSIETMLALAVKEWQGRISEDEATRLLQWRESHPEHELQFQQAKKIWQAQTGDLTVNISQAWQKVAIHMNTPTNRRYTWVWVAASISVLILLTWVLFPYFIQPKPTVLQTQHKVQHYIIADSNEIWLQPHSRLTYTRPHQLTLTGSAYIKAHTKLQVKVEQAQISLNHSAVNIKQEKQKPILITATEGSVQINTAEHQSLTLNTQQSAYLQEQRITLAPKISQNLLAWKTHQLQFENTRLQEVFTDLQDYFQVTIEVQDHSILQCRFTGNYTEPNLEQVLTVIALTLNLNFQKQPQGYLITGKGCSMS